MLDTRDRPELRKQAERQKSTVNIKSTVNSEPYKHSSRGFAFWLEVAPPTATWEEVVTAYQTHSDPREVSGWSE